jgi:hypothetical protein
MDATSQLTHVGRPFKLLLDLASTVNIGFEPRRDPCPYSCSFQDFRVFRNGTTSTTTGGVLLLLVNPNLLGVTQTGTHSLTGPFLHTWKQLIPESESQILYDWSFTANQVVLVPSPFRFTINFFLQLNSYGHSPCITSSLTRKWVCLY